MQHKPEKRKKQMENQHLSYAPKSTLHFFVLPLQTGNAFRKCKVPVKDTEKSTKNSILKATKVK